MRIGTSNIHNAVKFTVSIAYDAYVDIFYGCVPTFSSGPLCFCQQKPFSSYMGFHTPVKGQLKPDRWRHHLSGYWDQQLPSLIHYDFPLDFNKDSVCLYILVDTKTRTISIPSEKLMKIKNKCRSHVYKKHYTKTQFQSLLGSLLYITKCVRLARFFLNRMVCLDLHLV